MPIHSAVCAVLQQRAHFEVWNLRNMMLGLWGCPICRSPYVGGTETICQHDHVHGWAWFHLNGKTEETLCDNYVKKKIRYIVAHSMCTNLPKSLLTCLEVPEGMLLIKHFDLGTFHSVTTAAPRLHAKALICSFSSLAVLRGAQT